MLSTSFEAAGEAAGDDSDTASLSAGEAGDASTFEVLYVGIEEEFDSTEAEVVEDGAGTAPSLEVPLEAAVSST